MCGIFGVVGPHVPGPAVQNVLQTLQHRGPDGDGVFVDEPAGVTMAHTRLAVIDLATGAQPLRSEDGNITLICNGEIYDFENIRKSLQAKGYRFKTKSDSEVIIVLYQEFGLDCFEHLRGEFAFLLYDQVKRVFIAGRDRFGIKPLYFSRLPKGFVFASEMKAIFASDLVTAKLNIAALDPLLDQDPENVQFPFEDIEQVPPASYAIVDLDTFELSISRYWSAEIPAETAEPAAGSDQDAQTDAAALVLKELEEAVRLRLRADVPVGLYLSGGIDSAFVGALMKRGLNSFHSFSISFVGSDRNEREFARRAADLLGTEHHELSVTKEMLWEHLQQCLWFSELPFVTLAPVGKFLLSKEARKHVTVVLTGEGADEVFLGYRGFFERAIRDTRDKRLKGHIASARHRRLGAPGLSPAMIGKLSLLVFNKSHRRSLESARAKTSGCPNPSKPVINAVQEARIAGMPLDILCFLGDREEMAHSLEARLPFLDHKLYDAAKSIPVDFKMRDGVEKAVLRDAAKDILPEDLRLRRKRGFMVTSDAVDLFGADRNMAEQFRYYLSKQAFERSGIFSHRTYRAIRFLARLPASNRLPRLKRLRSGSNKIMMYMMQVHMLHSMFISDPPWAKSNAKLVEKRSEPTVAHETVN